MSSLDELRKERLEALNRLSREKGLQFPESRPPLLLEGDPEWGFRDATPPEFAPEAWFLGPKGENHEFVKTLLLDALASHVQHRKEFHPDDPPVITDDVKESADYRAAV